MSFVAPTTAIPRVGINASSKRSSSKQLILCNPFEQGNPFAADDVGTVNATSQRPHRPSQANATPVAPVTPVPAAAISEGSWDWAAPGLFQCDVVYRGVIITPVKFPKEASLTHAEFAALADSVSTHVQMTYKNVAAFKKGQASRLSISSNGMRMSSKKTGDVLMALPIERILTYRRDTEAGALQGGKNKNLSALILSEHPDPTIDTVICHRLEFKAKEHLSGMFAAFKEAFNATNAQPAKPAPAAKQQPQQQRAATPTAPAQQGTDMEPAVNRRILSDADVLDLQSTC